MPSIVLTGARRKGGPKPKPAGDAKVERRSRAQQFLKDALGRGARPGRRRFTTALAGSIVASSVSFGLYFVIAGAVCLVAGSVVPGIAVVVGGIAAGIVLLVLARAQSGATGDAHGAAIELGFAAALVAAAVLRP